MNDDDKTKEAIDKINEESVKGMPEGLELFEPENEGLVKNINQQDGDKQFVEKDIGYSQNSEEKKNERYTGPVTQAHYDDDELSLSYNSSNTEVHKSHITMYKKIALILLLLIIVVVAGLSYLLSTRNKVNSDIGKQVTTTLSVDDNSYESKLSRDTERKLVINNLYVQLESYYNLNGFYPNKISDSTLSNITTEDILDISGNPITNSPPQKSSDPPTSPYKSNEKINDSQAQYTYQPYSCTSSVNGSNCSKFILSSWLELDNYYEKVSLN